MHRRLRIDWGFSAVMWRGSGIVWGVRKHEPYDAHSQLSFQGVVGKTLICSGQHVAFSHTWYLVYDYGGHA